MSTTPENSDPTTVAREKAVRDLTTEKETLERQIAAKQGRLAIVREQLAALSPK